VSEVSRGDQPTQPQSAQIGATKGADVDVRRIVLIRRSLEEKRPWQHHRIGRAIVIVAFLFPNLVLSVGLVADFQATRSNTHDLKLALL